MKESGLARPPALVMRRRSVEAECGERRCGRGGTEGQMDRKR